MTDSVNRQFRERVQRRDAMLLPGVANALAARIAADVGFEALYLSGAGITNTFYGLPDLGFIGLSDLVQHTSAIRDAVDLPVMVDADTGFGNALNVRQTVRALERAGASSIQFEDQVMPKRCGHFDDKRVISAREMTSKIAAAVDARIDQDLQIVARTDARAMLGLEAAMERGQMFIEAGADILFIEAPQSVNEVLTLPRKLDAPHIINLVIGGKTPIISLDTLRDNGIALVLYANAALQGGIFGMRDALQQLRLEGRLTENSRVASFAERQRLVQKPEFDILSRRFAVPDDDN